MDRQLDKELRFHLDQHTEDLIDRGLDPTSAHRQASMALGGLEQVREDCRDARGFRWLEDLWQDVGYTVRSLFKNPGFTVAVLLTLALGAGATTIVFTAINGVLLKPLPYSEPDRLLAVHARSTAWNVKAFGEQNLAYLDFLDNRQQAHSLMLAGWVFDGGTVSRPGDPKYVDLRKASDNLFSALGVTPVLGRFFSAAEDHEGGTHVAVLGYSFWRGHFGGNPDVIGQSLVLDTTTYTVVGVAPESVRLGGREGDVYTPLGQDNAGYMRDRRPHPVTVIARLRPGTSLVVAQDELTAIGRGLAAQYPASNKDRTFTAARLRANVGDAGTTLWLLLGSVGFVLAIACVNVASLLLARSVARDRELALRSALGAKSGRLMRQCLAESTVLALCGGFLGILLASVGMRPFIAFWPGVLPRSEEVQLDWRVFMFTAGVSLLTGLLFGLAPALRGSTHDLERRLRVGARTIAGTSRRLQSTFVVCEVAIAVVLLVSAGMLGRTLWRLSLLDPGLDIRNVIVSRVALSPVTLADTGRIRAAWQDVLERAHRVPGIRAVATVDTVPMRQGNNQLGYWPSADLPPVNKQPLALATCVSDEYLNVMGIPLRRGRFFDDRDRIGSRPVIIIDDVLARDAFANADPIGKMLWVPDIGAEPYEVVGVIGHVRHWGLGGDDQAGVRAQFYYPLSQLPDRFLTRWSQLMSIAVRTDIESLSVLPALSHELQGAAGDQVLYGTRTMDQLANNSLATQRFLLFIFAAFASLALLLMAVGVYGVLAYLTNERVPEIGIRIALGESPGRVMREVIGGSLAMTSAGVVIGLLGAAAAARVLVHNVDGMSRMDVSTSALAVCILLTAAAVASWIPALRASRVDPIIALRLE
jgi:predicted permease